ncbi:MULTISPECIES: flagellar biosynthesis protein FlgB [Sphingomonadales]|uniref:Flagellar basal body rod protein FlgB n=2 Tax=Edaphosphingomonas TaxID=3423724 RepID=A0A2T4HPE3_9SPHN|nr:MULTISPECIES: flagellar biosynthesis protein FlgB [Sphingomonas]AGH49100.1 flagellar basal-body rod protein FlgB [Sphingomonas sp. MM-1]OHT21527.1 flagellar basal body rod protein FlgB [Sphingomonas haloaromaticamans]PTD17671.1 flagellar biosynthesis protein FlgB [Sphingomonas fennica]
MATAPTLLTGIHQSMKHLAERQRVIAENIANNETPRFKAREVEAPDFSELLAAQGTRGAPRVVRPRISLTSGMAALGARPPQAGSNVVLDRDTTETKPDGNNVTIEDQLLKMGQVQADFTAMTNLYRKQMSLLKSAIGRN